MASIEIDGKKIDAEPGMMIIEAADAHDIWIPRFCYHKKLSIAANCRMCLVDVEKTGKPLPACATPITDGMKIWTKSKKAIQAQKGVMEFLLINHPLDCPICDQGGECELQDISMGYGSDVSRFNEKKRVVIDQDLGPLVASDMTRCIQCTRCVRFGTEISGVRELGAVGRGEHMEIGTFIERNIDSEVSGNVIELCPVGALTSKPYRFEARGWELQQKPSIAAHDCIGSNIYLHIRRNKVMRVVPQENENVNEIWISDRDRFSYQALNTERLATPKIKHHGKFEAVSWEEALEYAVQKLKKVVAEQGPEAIGGLLSPNSTTEEAYLFQKWMRGLGSSNVDHRLRQVDFRGQEEAPMFPNLGLPLAELENQSLVLLVGSLIRQEQPSLSLKLRKMTLASGKVMVINPIDCDFNFDVYEKIIVPGGDLLRCLASVAKALLGITKNPIPQGALSWLAAVPEARDSEMNMAKALLSHEKPAILLGALALHHPEASHLMAVANLIKEMTKATVGCLTEGANAAGASIAGIKPHRLPAGKVSKIQGLNAQDMWSQKLKGYVLFGIEPHLDCADPRMATNALAQADCVIAFTPFQSPELEAVADVLLPSTPFTETAGTFINACGMWQTFQGWVKPYEESRPGWKILRVLANLCDIQDMDYASTEEVLVALKQEMTGDLVQESKEWVCPGDALQLGSLPPASQVIRLAPVPIYSADNLVRRAYALQKTTLAQSLIARLNKRTAAQLNLEGAQLIEVVSAQHQTIVIPVVIDEAVPDHSVVVPAGLKETAKLGAGYTAVVLKAMGDLG